MKRMLQLVALGAGLAAARADELLPPMTQGVPSEYAPRRAGADVDARHRIQVAQYGLYRLTYSNLVAAGISNPVGSELRLYCRTQEVALATSQEGPWGQTDHAVFFGWPHDGDYTTTNTYWLGVGGTGLRMTTRSGAPRLGAVERTTHVAVARYDVNATRRSPTDPRMDPSTTGSPCPWAAAPMCRSRSGPATGCRPARRR